MASAPREDYDDSTPLPPKPQARYRLLGDVCTTKLWAVFSGETGRQIGGVRCEAGVWQYAYEGDGRGWIQANNCHSVGQVVESYFR